jgi:hypothetical protein
VLRSRLRLLLRPGSNFDRRRHLLSDAVCPHTCLTLRYNSSALQLETTLHAAPSHSPVPHTLRATNNFEIRLSSTTWCGTHHTPLFASAADRSVAPGRPSGPLLPPLPSPSLTLVVVREDKTLEMLKKNEVRGRAQPECGCVWFARLPHLPRRNVNLHHRCHASRFPRRCQGLVAVTPGPAAEASSFCQGGGYPILYI